MLLMAAPNGARKTKDDHPELPITLPETVACARACHAAGADALHLHVRDAAGAHSLDPGLYRAALDALAEAVPQMRVQVTTEAAGQFTPAQQFATLQALVPDWTTLSVREMATDPGLAREVYAFCADHRIEVQHILYDAQDAALLSGLQDTGILGGDASVILVLGRYTKGMVSDPDDLPAFLAALPPVGRWMLCAFGRREHDCLRAAARLGGDLRVGFENAHIGPDGTPWPDMASSVRALRDSLGDEP
ncbi:3-keto-5-aminohexanoate cleavage protein [Aliishimia ponticola]|uniref:3-keto-5-aminohexanoate cleavage protein n=1 Tax=Aliishimia ponticola TaxID=2499833 RepID=A0A4S4N5K7_9RHOB|nr:3-keto-5-aminohexanoate cleavage protein [Aliishimia ponticola]THH34374.1 3-keto-5-aminohexanoate cleavage protein [Aliishimia ponticola]